MLKLCWEIHNWNENSVTRNREAGIIIENEELAQYYAAVFFYDWNLTQPQPQDAKELQQLENKNTIYISLINLFIYSFTPVTAYWLRQLGVSSAFESRTSLSQSL